MAFEPSTGVAVLAAAIAATVTIVLFVYALGLRIAHILYERDLARLRVRWWPILARASMAVDIDVESELPPLRRGLRIKLLREWCRFRAHIKGNTGPLETIAEKLGFRRVARRMLQRHAIGQKLLGIQALGFLRDAESWDELETLIGHPNVSISITAASALVHIDVQTAAVLVIPMISKRPDWPRTQVGRMLSIAGPDVVTRPLCDAIRAAPADEACQLLQFYESAAIEAFDELLRHLLASRHEPALLAAALKAVRRHLPNTIIERLARHEVWYVRTQAASLLGRFGRREDYRILEPLLADSEWWVRYRAAQAIARLPFLGPHALRKLRDRQQDRYARDIFCQALAEAGLV